MIERGRGREGKGGEGRGGEGRVERDRRGERYGVEMVEGIYSAHAEKMAGPNGSTGREVGFYTIVLPSQEKQLLFGLTLGMLWERIAHH